MSLLIVGSIGLDNVRTPFGERTEVLGGSASFASLAASTFGSVQLVGVVGEDFPDSHVQMLRQRGIDTQGLQVRPGKTFRWGGYYELDMNQAHTEFTNLNVFADFDPVLPVDYRSAEYVFLANIDPRLQRQVLSQVTKPKLVILDTMNYWITSAKDELIKTLGMVDIALMNEAEVRQLTGQPSVVKGAREVLSWGPWAVIIKRGENGATLFQGDHVFSLPGFPLENIIDPTGAGDSFAGGFIGYLSELQDLSQKSLRQAIAVGSTVASISVEAFSVENIRNLHRDTIAARYDEYCRLVHFDSLALKPVLA
ncbi:MAG: sugar kinase [Candidatus Sericytochromatia bacterium]|nr:sugar kinase [Candidatus Sericytochromatia bacterium]